MMSITVIVPTYNRAAMLSETLAGLAVQTRPLAEILVWDDGSTDGTEDVARAAAGPVRYFRSTNAGKARALNAAMAEARGEFIWICDDDDIALPDAAETLADMLVAAPQAGAAAGSYVRFRDDPDTGARIESGPGYWPDLSHGSVLRHLLEDIFLFQNATLVRRALYDRTGPFREDLARSIDYDMAVRLAVRSPIVVTEAVVFRQRKHGGERGPAAARHAAAASDAVWKAADRAVFEPFRESIPLALYTALFEGRLAERAGLLQRGCVYARRTNWQAAAEDFEAAATIEPAVALGAEERAICRRAMAGKHGVTEALTSEIRSRLARLPGLGPAGADIASALARGVTWRGRKAITAGRAGEAAAIAAFVLAIGRPQWRRSGLIAPPLSERRELPPTAWLP